MTAKFEHRDSTISERFAQFSANFDPRSIPDAVLAQAKLCILDSLGIALAASTYNFSQSALAAALLLGGAGSAPVFAQAQRLPLRDAILANGTLIHALDFDDTHSASVVHCTASAWPVAFGVGHDVCASGLDALAAFTLAVELDARIGAPAAGRLQKRGFHPTGIVGAFGCAAASAYLRRLNAAQHRDALGIVLSMAAGSMAFINDGAWTKRIHAGWAGVCGVTAAALAETGFVGPSAPFEGKFGLYETLLGDEQKIQTASIGDDLGINWRVNEVAFKPYPACHFNHAFADCALAIKHEQRIAVSDIESITALIHPDQVPIVCEPLAAKRRPGNTYEAQFSVPYMVAATLINDRFTLEELEPAAINDPATQALAARIDYAEDPNSAYPQYYSAGLIVRTHSGAEAYHHIAVNRGADALPLNESDIHEKFLANASRAVSMSHAKTIMDIVSDLQRAPNLDELADAISCGAASSDASVSV